ncbi:tRNA pseudouridine synthase 1; AltName: Full=tRNA pseudouridylate synthase 1; AltName: Full=tRNA-uridine isomerase 1 [Serendipita indica DSM 11827]|uniref:tRNA pseudouridine synthase 1 n=1 Tax=Serendipita indica (strain DSM 11827) TaxID=1109443 RepID=G4TT12_SERID|nr:tRNA pseudouridine synthase 1; AltName: Full=tRNA pseudouridylate synthase 1; AltName: Full=tRNA-uridine isomerase 1 [Serendipita indica DSM 11827]CCA74448.1 related to PUS1-pseudouridine synthase 1 [Serendipita indica DSM 11827]
MAEMFNSVTAPIRRIISRGLSFPTLSRFTSFNSSNTDQSPLPSAGKRQREESEDEAEGPSKRVKMDVDSSLSPAKAPNGEHAAGEVAAVEAIRPGVEALSLVGATPPPNGTASVQSSPESSRRTKYQRGLRGTRKTGTNDPPTPSKPRLGPKRQCAMLIGFCGTGYSGMQIQKDAKTIEGSLFSALVKVGAVSEDNSDDATKVNIQRAARTDAGVHAARNVVSIKIIMDVPGVPNLVAAINSNLPEEIRVWDIVRTQNSFNSRTRKYTYFLPTYMLLPPEPTSVTATALRESSGEAYDVAEHPFWKSVANQPITPESTLFMLRKKWRIDEDTLNRFKAALNTFIGTHNFWNFTVGREYKEAAAKRHIKTIEVSEPAIYGETEWVSVQIHGQSFMLHQRKMIALATFLTRSQGDASLVQNLYTSSRARIPKAPALGLLLEEPVFESYNKKIETANSKWKDAAASGSKEPDEDGEHAANFIREPVDFGKHRDEIEEFKKKYIYAEMQRTEDEQGVFDSWLSSIDNHEARLYYELRGQTVPSELNVPTKPGSTRSAASKFDDGDESDDALGNGKVNLRSVELEG